MDETSASRLGGFAAAFKPVSQRRTCLYIEDSDADLLLVEKLIARRRDLHLLTAHSGPAGLKMARDFRPDIILMEINLPGASGMEILAALRGDPSTAHIPVTALTSNAFPSQIEEGLRGGFFRYITKPFKIADFTLAVDDMLLRAIRRAPRRESQDIGHHRRESAAG